MSSASDDRAPDTRGGKASQPPTRNLNRSRLGGWLASALFFGSLGILLVEFGEPVTNFGEPVLCGLGNPPCSSTTPRPVPAEQVDHPFAWLGALLIGYALICLIFCVIAWRRSR